MRRRVATTRVRAALVGAIVFWLTPVAGAFAQDASLEYAIKATYLYKFGPFIQWPPAAFASAAVPFNLCIVGIDPFGRTLDAAIQGQQIAERSIVVRRLDMADRSSGCQMAYIAGPRAADALTALRGAPVLTITDAAPDERSRGIVNFVVLDNRVRFEIDARAAAANGISISSKLQSLAVPLNSQATP